MPVHYCAICNRSFSRSQHLVRHSRIHTGETPYKCLQCTESFKRSDMLKRHVLAAHSDDVSPKQSTASTSTASRKKSTSSSSPEDQENDDGQAHQPETSQTRGVSFSGSSQVDASWQSDSSLNPQPPPPPSSSTSFDPSRFSYIPPPPPPPPPQSIPNYAPQIPNPNLQPYPYPLHPQAAPPPPQVFAPPTNYPSTFNNPHPYPLGPSPLLSSGPKPGTPFDFNGLSQYGFVPAFHDAGGGPGPSTSSFASGNYLDPDPALRTPMGGAQIHHLYDGMLSPGGRTGGNLDWSEMERTTWEGERTWEGQRKWEGVDENWIAHTLGTTDGLDWDGGMNYRLAEKLGILDPSQLPLPPPTMAFTNATSAPSSIYPTQPAPTPSPPALSHHEHSSESSTSTVYSTPPSISSSNTAVPAAAYKGPIADYANSLRSFNHAVLSTLPIPEGTPTHLLPLPELLHYQSHPHLYVASHFGVPPPANSPMNNFGIEGDNHHQYVEGRLPSPSNQPQLDPLNVLPMTIFERRNLKKAMVELEIGLDGGKVGARKSGIRNETEGIAGVPMGRSFALETVGMFKARDRVTDLELGGVGEGIGEGVRVVA